MFPSNLGEANQIALGFWPPLIAQSLASDLFPIAHFGHTVCTPNGCEQATASRGAMPKPVTASSLEFFSHSHSGEMIAPHVHGHRALRDHESQATFATPPTRQSIEPPTTVHLLSVPSLGSDESSDGVVMRTIKMESSHVLGEVPVRLCTRIVSGGLYRLVEYLTRI
jgi:hypothetical protein